MNNLKTYLHYNSPAYTDFVNKNPKIAQAIAEIEGRIQSSIFKDRVQIHILIWDKEVCVDPSIIWSHSNVNKVNAYSSVYCGLISDLKMRYPVEECDMSTF